MPTLEELTKMVEEAGGDPQKLADATKAALAELTGAQTALHTANKEAAERRKRLDALEAEEAKRKEAEMTEAQKLAEHTKALEERANKAEQEKLAIAAKAQETLTRSMLLVKASEAGFNDPADAWQFVDKSKITINETTGEVEGIDKALEELAKAKPYLLKDPAASRPLGTPPAKKQLGGNKPDKKDAIPTQRVAY